MGHRRTWTSHGKSVLSKVVANGPRTIEPGMSVSEFLSASQNPSVASTSPSSMCSPVIHFLYTRTPRCTFSSLSHHNIYITKFRVAKATVTSSNSMIGRPWAPHTMHCITNYPVCSMTTPLEMASPLLLSSISAFEILGKSPFPIRE
jgi:hypothetical protein